MFTALRAALAALAFVMPIAAAAADIPRAWPEEQGVASVGLARYIDALNAQVDSGRLAGYVSLVSRRGKVVSLDAHGRRDLTGGAPMTADTIFRIASMTKPVTGVAMMQLWEEGKWSLDDPVAKHIPEFADLKVKGADGALVPQASPMTMRQLMSHTAGFDVSAGYDGPTAIVDLKKPLQAMIDRLAALPLADQPGTDWNYGPSVNIQGYLVEKLSGLPLDVYFERRIFAPLGMTDTGLWVPTAKAGRLAAINSYDAAGKLIPAPSPSVPVDPTVKPVFLAGSGGLYSTASDYWRFAQMLLDDGALGGKRLLKRETVALMRTSVLPTGVAVDLYGPAQAGTGFGLDFAVLDDPAAAGSPQGKGSYYWGGAFGTWFWIDPVNELVVVGMIQNLRGSIPGAGTPDVRSLSVRSVYESLER